MRLVLSTLALTSLLASPATACFCPSLFTSSCGCGGGGGAYPSYSPVGYNGAYQTQGYATFFRDLTPFRQPYQPQQVPAYPQPYPRALPPALPPTYRMPNPRYILPQAAPPAPPPPPPVPQYVAPRPVERPVYIQPAATVAPIVEAPRTTLHDNFYGAQEEVIVTTRAPIVTTTEVPDFVDEAPVKTNEKEEFYYVYYDDKGNKVGDSRTGSTFAPENVIEELTTVAPTQAHVSVPSKIETTTQVEINQSYDDVVEEPQAPVRTSLATPEIVTSTTVLFIEPSTVAPSTNTEIIYEDETVEYEDNGEQVTAGPIDKKPTSSGGYKRTVQDNQILVQAAEDRGEEYKKRIAVNGVKIIKRYPKDKRKIHEN